MSRQPVRRTPAAFALEVVLLALATAAAWWGWLGWDHSYYRDARTGEWAGPYQPWQVAGCVLTLLAIGVIAYWRLPAWVVGVTVTLSFTLAFAASSLPEDETGLAMVGVLMVLVGTAVATTLLGVVAYLVRGIARGPSGSVGHVHEA